MKKLIINHNSEKDFTKNGKLKVEFKKYKNHVNNLIRNEKKTIMIRKSI